ncbi:MAG: hypothetical protein KC561_00775 [Myxococcales bacterium]|nr:hypothetical protein [Myxococcales bacterium]
MAREGKPWLIMPPIFPTMRLTQPLFLSYYVPYRAWLEFGSIRFPLSLGTRVDRIAAREGYLGHTFPTSNHAVVLLDRTAETAANDLWPALSNPTGVILPAHARALGPSVRDELISRFGEDAFAALVETAEVRRRLIEVVYEINERTSCSHFTMFQVPLRGYDSDELERMQRWIQPVGDCAAITGAEHQLLNEISRQLGRTPGLREGIQSLTAAMARTVAVHEIRHVMDGAQPVECSECPSYLDEQSIRELSAYSAEIAHGDLPMTAFFQVCHYLHMEDRNTPHARALRFLTTSLGECGNYPPSDFADQARQLDLRLFGEREVIPLPEDFPTRLRTRDY